MHSLGSGLQLEERPGRTAAAPRQAIIIAGLAGLVAGAMSMAAGEYVSVSSQRDAEQADIQRESRELARDPSWELGELTELYVRRGLDPALAQTMAEKLSAADPLATHMREELGLLPGGRARPVQAALVSALRFAVGAALPLVVAVSHPTLCALSRSLSPDWSCWPPWEPLAAGWAAHRGAGPRFE